ncbi:hypothetical protein ACVWWO_007857 [Bradyrhizobium sp. F1.13.1]
MDRTVLFGSRLKCSTKASANPVPTRVTGTTSGDHWAFSLASTSLSQLRCKIRNSFKIALIPRHAINMSDTDHVGNGSQAELVH